MRVGTSLLEGEDPQEGELFWDPHLRRIGVWNFEFSEINWFRLPGHNESVSYIPKHEINEDEYKIRWQQFDGSWGDWAPLPGSNLFLEQQTIDSEGSGSILFDISDGNVVKVADLEEDVYIEHFTDNVVLGMEVTIFFKQDATGGRAIEWDDFYKLITLDESATANQKAIVKLVFDGNNWVQTYTSGWY